MSGFALSCRPRVPWPSPECDHVSAGAKDFVEALLRKKPSERYVSVASWCCVKAGVSGIHPARCGPRGTTACLVGVRVRAAPPRLQTPRPPPPLPRTWLLLCYWHRYRLSAKDALTHPWVTQKSRMHEGEDAAHVLDKHNEIVQALQHFATMGNHKKLALEVRFSRGRKPQQVGDGGRGGCWSRSRAPSFGVRLLGCRCAIGFDGAPIVAGDCVLYAAGKASRAA